MLHGGASLPVLLADEADERRGRPAGGGARGVGGEDGPQHLGLGKEGAALRREVGEEGGKWVGRRLGGDGGGGGEALRERGARLAPLVHLAHDGDAGLYQEVETDGAVLVVALFRAESGGDLQDLGGDVGRGGGGAARGEQGLGLAPDPFPDGRIEGADELEEQLVQLVVRFGLVAAALVEPHDGVPQLLELGEDLLGLPPEAAGEEGRPSELLVGPLLEVGVGPGDLGVEGNEEGGCGCKPRKPVDEAHDLLAGPLADDDLVEEDLVDGVVDRSEGALVHVRDGDEPVELGVVHKGAGDGGSGASKLLGQLDLVGEGELNVLGHARATLRGVRLLVQLDQRVGVARDDLA